MSSEFIVYLRLGVEHIADLQAYDHLLFVTALCVGYSLSAWRSLLVLITAFTIGHSLTLVLATLNVLAVSIGLVETLIPITIILASLVNIAEANRGVRREQESSRSRSMKYGVALVFGLIHGVGFSSFLRAALGAEESIVAPLFAFNVGLELGQIAIVAVVLLIGAFLIRFFGLERRTWVLTLSGATAGIATTMVIERLAG